MEEEAGFNWFRNLINSGVAGGSVLLLLLLLLRPDEAEDDDDGGDRRSDVVVFFNVERQLLVFVLVVISSVMVAGFLCEAKILSKAWWIPPGPVPVPPKPFAWAFKAISLIKLAPTPRPVAWCRWCVGSLLLLPLVVAGVREEVRDDDSRLWTVSHVLGTSTRSNLIRISDSIFSKRVPILCKWLAAVGILLFPLPLLPFPTTTTGHRFVVVRS